MTFKEKLIGAARKNNSWLCVGLDPDLSQIPEHLGHDIDAILKFNRAVIEATCDLVCAYKPNGAFYESLGSQGWELLIETAKSIPENIPLILDFKRGDIGNTAKMYARSAFEIIGADAVTVSPYMGTDSFQPFLDYVDKGVFVLCLTSNPSAFELQKKIVLLENPPSAEWMTPQAKARTFAEFFGASTTDLYLLVASLVPEWNKNDNVGLVVGATVVSELEAVRKKVGGEIPILIPGVGAQGGDLERSVDAGSNGRAELAIINIARGVIYAGGQEKNFRQKIRAAAENYRAQIMDAATRKIKYSAGR
ncbi:MAG: orotidine 5'-phosphate decarboxylase [candidate division Zixibacteria bacterium RBG_16_53_22]|nr:MAG: orotidine 5'-phosphate decarboxylase [candidate division Zixibacteria bacterium RBG_16_53_22]